MRKPVYSLSCFILFVLAAFHDSNAQPFTYSRRIEWQPVRVVPVSPADTVTLLNFSGANYPGNEYGPLPVYWERFRLGSPFDSVLYLSISDPVFSPLEPGEEGCISQSVQIPEQIRPQSRLVVQRKIPELEVTLLPFRRNNKTGKTEKLVSFSLVMEIAYHPEKTVQKAARTYAGHSCLSQGTWYRFPVTTRGIHIITYSDLAGAGINPSGIDPRNIRIYGNGGGMLPESNAQSRTDDLRENAVYVQGEEDGVFNESDYILFYGESPDTWIYDSQFHLFHHVKHLYSEATWYYLTFDNGPGKRLGYEPSITTPPTNTITTFNDYAFYEVNDLNLIKSGKEWFDKSYFELTSIRNYSFTFPDIDPVHPVEIQVDVAARSTAGATSFNVAAGSQPVMTIPIPATSPDYLANYAIQRIGKGSFNTGNPVIDIKLTYNKGTSGGIGYLNSIELNVHRALKLSGSQMAFRSVLSSGPGKTAHFTVTTGGQQVLVWDVSDPSEAKQIGITLAGTECNFRVPTDTIREFVIFDGSAFYPVSSFSRVDNQDLHATGNVDFVIVSHPTFLGEAGRLADHHIQHDNMSVLIVTPEQVYNEFSSGSQDISAIRDFMKMLYDRAGPGEEPKYLLLFGDASYDYLNRVTDNSNFVPAFQSAESLDPVESFVTDDFFGILDDNEGGNAAGEMDLGVGRFPVRSVEEAREAVNKVLHYTAQSDSVKNDWRNILCFVADDEDNNIHMNQTEDLTGMIQANHKEYNIDKIYLDAYPQVSTPGGARYPEVNSAINQRITRGALIINYVGHGGELGWAHERVLEIPDIKSWANFDRMPVFITATCEFTRYDDPGFISAGEWVFLNPDGGGISLFTTTRPTFAGLNDYLTTNFYTHAFNKTNGEFPRMGDLIVLSKQGISGNINTKKFVLLGDPAMQIAYPRYSVVTTAVNGNPVSPVPDTLKALDPVMISGEIRDDSGNRMTGFNGTLFATVYDKASEIVTLGNDGETPLHFFLRKNIIYKGKTEVSAGEFSFSFIVPKDIAYQYGSGRISYYARSTETDANGFDEGIVVGGYSNNPVADTSGPVIRMFMNDTLFVNGGITDQNPVLLALVSDESGINTVGNGIGHDITAILDDNTKDLLILNDYYQSDLNTYKSGYIAYPFFGLSEGYHTLRLKVWDVYNNSSEAAIGFQVMPSSSLVMVDIFNYPNPFRYQTTFSFSYNHPNTSMDVSIDLYNMMGMRIRTLRRTVYTSGYRTNEITWDGTSDSGMIVGSGTYVYFLRITLPDGSSAYGHSKLIYSR